MQLTVRDVAKFLNVPVDTVHRMIQCGEIPAIRVQDQYQFSRTEILEWAMDRHIKVSPGLLGDESDSTPAEPSLSSALRRGGIFYNLESGDKSTALRSMVRVLRLPDCVDRELLFRMYVARETMASTGIGDGIAIPHVRNPVVLQVPTPQVTLCFLKSPVDFGAVDRKPVFALFSLVTPTIRAHLALLSRLAFVLRDPGLLEFLRSQAPEDRIMASFERNDASSTSSPCEPQQEARQ